MPPISVTVATDSEEVKEYRIKRAKITEKNVLPRVSTLDKTVGIIKVTSFNTTTAEQFKKAVEELIGKGCDKFVFDMRGNPGGELNAVVNTLDYLLPEGPVIRIFDANGKQVDEKKSNAECINYPMSVIVNGGTASAAELFTSALMDYNKATVVGEITYGKGSMQTTLPLTDGEALKITYRLYKPPYSEGYDGVGITPDVVVSLSEEAAKKNIFKLTDEEDDQLLAAIASFKK
jgi:carboxyl-terminal processing protease